MLSCNPAEAGLFCGVLCPVTSVLRPLYYFSEPLREASVNAQNQAVCDRLTIALVVR